MHAFLIIAGLLVLAATAVDLIWTTIGTHGGSPLSKHLTQLIWNTATALHRLRPNHYGLSFAGAISLLSMIAFWIAMAWFGWVLIFSSDPAALINAQSGAHPSLAGRIYFVGYTMSSLGNGDYQPRPGGWQVVVATVAISGICSLTLAVSFILSVVTAIIEKRSLAALIDAMGGSPEEILRRAWTGESFEGLEQFLLQLTTLLAVSIEQHLAYPVLHQFHGEMRRTSPELRLNSLHEMLLLLAEGAAPEVRLPRMYVQPLRDALDAMAKVFREEYVGTTGEVPPCSLDVLRALSIPTVSNDDFRASVAKTYDTRQALYAALLDDGWTWEDVWKTSATRATSVGKN